MLNEKNLRNLENDLVKIIQETGLTSKVAVASCVDTLLFSDIDECATDNESCSQICSKICSSGSFECQCQCQYTLLILVVRKLCNTTKNNCG